MKETVSLRDNLSSANAANVDLGFLPRDLTVQCRDFIAGYHLVHGFAGLPDMLWRHRLGPFIEQHCQLRVILRRASTTRSAKEANDCFVDIASAILAMEILATNFAGWNVVHGEAGSRAGAILNEIGHDGHAPLLEFYLSPLRYPVYSKIPAPIDLSPVRSLR